MISRMVSAGTIVAFVLLSGSLAAEENLQRVTLSFKRAWFLGAAVLPFVELYHGRVHSPEGKQDLSWSGFGGMIRPGWVTPLYYQDEASDWFLSTHADIGIIHWYERALRDSERHYHRTKADKGYSAFWHQKFRGNLILGHFFGVYMEAGLGAEWWMPRSLEEGEIVRDGAAFWYSGGIGFLFIFPFPNRVIVDAGFEMMRQTQGAPSDPLSFNVQVGVNFEVW
jgi:hypothetical protein